MKLGPIRVYWYNVWWYYRGRKRVKIEKSIVQQHVLHDIILLITPKTCITLQWAYHMSLGWLTRVVEHSIWTSVASGNFCRACQIGLFKLNVVYGQDRTTTRAMLLNSVKASNYRTRGRTEKWTRHLKYVSFMSYVYGKLFQLIVTWPFHC